MGGVWPYPVTLASFFVSPWLQFIVIVLMSLWFFGWVGTVFLTASRVIFATAFDRILPEWAARRRPPRHALLRDPDHARAVADHLVLLRVQLDVHATGRSTRRS